MLKLVILTLWLLCPPAGATQAVAQQTGNGGATLTVEVVPDEALIYIDNEERRPGSVKLSSIRPGSYKVEARLEGYYREVRYVTVSFGEERTLSLELRRITGLLEVNTSPADAQLLIDGEPVDSPLLELPPGYYDLTVRRFGYLTHRERLLVPPEQERR